LKTAKIPRKSYGSFMARILKLAKFTREKSCENKRFLPRLFLRKFQRLGVAFPRNSNLRGFEKRRKSARFRPRERTPLRSYPFTARRRPFVRSFFKGEDK
jgi:hypothetical protein